MYNVNIIKDFFFALSRSLNPHSKYDGKIFFLRPVHLSEALVGMFFFCCYCCAGDAAAVSRRFSILYCMVNEIAFGKPRFSGAWNNTLSVNASVKHTQYLVTGV